MNFDIEEAAAILARTPGVLMALLDGLPPAWTTCDEGPETWSPIDVVGHLIHGERTDWIPRAEIILSHGESRPFEPFDRFAQMGRHADPALPELLNEFSRLRADNLRRLRELVTTEECLELTGRHPEFGTVTLRQLLATWVAHDLTHIAQVVRVMANRYATDVGPWGAYLSILKRSGQPVP